MSGSRELGVPDYALTAWEALHEALDRSEITAPCTVVDRDRDEWHGSRPQQVRAAAACLDCPAMVACAAYAAAADELEGVWGGITQHERAEQRATARRTA